MSSTQSDSPQTIPWPTWMLRFIATDDDEAFWDLVWSVGGSPPYGGVSYEEGKAVYDLIEDYRGPGMASEDAYAAVQAFVEDDPTRRAVLDAFRANDTITSAPESLDVNAVSRGEALAETLDHDGLRCLFKAYAAQLAHARGDVAGARDMTLEGLRLGLALASEDKAYAHRVAQLAQNAVALTDLAGDREGALRLRDQFAEILDPEMMKGE